jgi:hypothetical protein
VSVENAKNRGERIDPALSRITLGGWAQQWIESQAHLKPSKRDRYERILEVQILPEWERVRLSAITHADVVGWVARLSADGYAAATIRQVHRVFSLLLGLAVRDGRLSRNPAEGVGLPGSRPRNRSSSPTSRSTSSPTHAVRTACSCEPSPTPGCAGARRPR